MSGEGQIVEATDQEKQKAKTSVAAQPPVVKPLDFQPLDAYCLIPRRTKTGLTYVARAEWEDWFGKLVTTNERRVSGWFGDRLDAVPWCRRYCNDHPGCLTAEQAKSLLRATATAVATEVLGPSRGGGTNQ